MLRVVPVNVQRGRGEGLRGGETHPSRDHGSHIKDTPGAVGYATLHAPEPGVVRPHP